MSKKSGAVFNSSRTFHAMDRPATKKGFCREKSERQVASPAAAVATGGVEASAWLGPSLEASSSSEGRGLRARGVLEREAPRHDFQDLLAREALRDEKVLALQQEVKELRGFVEVLAAGSRPGGEETLESAYSESLSPPPSPRGCCALDHPAPVERQRNGLRAAQSPVRQWSGEVGAGRPVPRATYRGGSPIRQRSGDDEIHEPRRDLALLEEWEGVPDEESPEDSDFENEIEPPPTMYAYCVHCICCSDDLWTLKEAWYLILLLSCQVTLIFSFSVSESVKQVNQHMTPFYDSKVQEMECIYWPMNFHHRPWCFIVTVACTTLVVLCYMKVKDRDTMLTLHLEPRSRCAKCLITYAWFIQAIWLPCMFCGCTANLLWLSDSTRSVIMNSVSLAYLLEIDSYMFSAFISDENKALYQKEVLAAYKFIDFSQVQVAEWRLYRIGFVQCAILTAIQHFLNYFRVEGEMYLRSLWCASIVYMFVYGGRASVMKFMRPDDESAETYVMSGNSYSPIWSSILGFVHFGALALVFAPTIISPTATVACARNALN